MPLGSKPLSDSRGMTKKWLADVKKSLPVERLATVSYVDVKKLAPLAASFGGPQAKPVIDALGLGNVTSYVSVTGLLVYLLLYQIFGYV